MAKVNNIPRKSKRIGKLPGSRTGRKVSRKLNKFNFALILGLYALHFKVFSTENLETLKNYTKLAWNYVISLF